MDGREVRILVVEDSDVTATVIDAVLRGEGYGIAGRAQTGAEAVQMARAERPDLVLMDIALPGETDGIEAARTIRETTDCAVVFLTAFTGNELLDRARAVEPHGYLLKPLDGRALRPAIEIALHKRRMEREREDLIERLQTALAEVAQLKELLPLCAWCRRVRDDTGYWEHLEDYMAKHLKTTYTHGICAECEAELEGKPAN